MVPRDALVTVACVLAALPAAYTAEVLVGRFAAAFPASCFGVGLPALYRAVTSPRT